MEYPGAEPMGAAWAWLTTVLILLGGVLVLDQLGVNVAIVVSNGLHGLEHALDQPIFG
jgi:hypothetical protein